MYGFLRDKSLERHGPTILSPPKNEWLCMMIHKDVKIKTYMLLEIVLEEVRHRVIMVIGSYFAKNDPKYFWWLCDSFMIPSFYVREFLSRK